MKPQIAAVQHESGANHARSSDVQLRGLTKIFQDSYHKRENVAVNKFDLNIQAGELVTLLGPSGCGKTTVLRMLAGFETPTSGQILVSGTDVSSLPPNKRNSAMVFQSYALFPHMCVEENICYGLKLRKLGAEETKQRLEKVIALAGLKGFERRRPNELSGGQQQRVALARALVIEPSLLLFDEPLSNLDAQLRESMRIEIRRIQKSLGITAVYVTHDQVEAMAISDRIVVMRGGCLEQQGRPQEVYLRPQSRFVAEFMGAANFVDARIARLDADAAILQVQGGELRVPYIAAQARAGAEVTLVARPENLHVSRAGGEGWRGKVEEHTYLGGHHEYRVRLEGGRSALTVREPMTARGPVFEAGDAVTLQPVAENLHYIVNT